MKTKKILSVLLTAGIAVSMFAGAVRADEVEWPLEETATFTGLISYPSGTEEEPNNRTIFKRLEEKSNVHIDWTAISSDQWGDKIGLAMANFELFYVANLELLAWENSCLTVIGIPS